LHKFRAQQRGVVLIFTLIILLILAIGAVALMRSVNTSLYGAGNLAFRRDLVNQGEVAVANVMAEFTTGDLSPTGSTSPLNNVPADNYSAVMLATNTVNNGQPSNQGVPLVLLQSTLGTVGTHADLQGATPDVKIRYVIDRLCTATGAPNSTICVQTSSLPPGGTAGMSGTTAAAAGLQAPTVTVYRLTVRVSDSRGTQVFLQTTFTRPD
jgi:Tfp pilus assembly protein PilX